MELYKFIDDLNQKTANKVSDFSIKPVDSIKQIYNKAYLETPTWLSAEDIICVFIDLNESTAISNIKQASIVAKILMAFTQNLVDTYKSFEPAYLDIKGDGAFALFEGINAHNMALAAAVSFKTFNEKHNKQYCKSKFNVDIDCKIGIDKGKVLVKKIGLRDMSKEKKSNEVWAGKLVNNTAKLSDIAKEIKANGILADDDTGCIVASDRFYKALKNDNKTSDYTVMSCGCPHNKKANLWKEYTNFDKATFHNSDNYQRVRYLQTRWCDIHGEEFCNLMISSNNSSKANSSQF